VADDAPDGAGAPPAPKAAPAPAPQPPVTSDDDGSELDADDSAAGDGADGNDD
jgi:hypothetical protein